MKKKKKKNFNYTISQIQLIDEILQKFKVTNIRKIKMTCSEVNKLSINNKRFDKTTYKSAIGSLIFLARCTRSDIAYATGKVARHSKNPTIENLFH